MEPPQLTTEQRAERFAHRLVVVLLNLHLHSIDHPEVEDQAALLIEDLRELAESCAPEPVQLRVSGEHLQLGDRVLLRASLQAGRLLRLCRERSIAALQFEPQLSANEMLRFLQLLTDNRESTAFALIHLPLALKSRGIRHVHVELNLRLDLQANASEALWIRPASPDAVRHYQSMAEVLHDSHVAGARGAGLEVDAATGVVEQTIAQMDHEPSGLLALAMYDDIDQFTVGHSVRVTLLALQVASTLDVRRRDLLRLGTAALLHDIGKSRIPQHILFKQGPLDPDEQRAMAAHARLGGELLLEHGGIDSAAIGAAFCHHMGPGGQGYPEPALPFEPSGISRLVRVCDVFEALTSIRPYKAATPPLQAYAIMHRMVDGFDQRWLRAFIRCIGLYPVGSRLILDTGEEAVVIADGPALDRPAVRILCDPDGAPLAAGAPAEVTIGVPEDGVVRRIQTVVGAGTRLELPPHDHATVADPEVSCGCHADVTTTRAARPDEPTRS